MASADCDVPGVEGDKNLHPRKLFVSGLDRGDGSIASQER